jgi:hypothetical protein
MLQQRERPKGGRLLIRVGICLLAGFLLTFLMVAAMDFLWPYMQDENYRTSTAGIILVRAVNLPAVIYCSFFPLPAGLPSSDKGMYCWSIGFFFNIPYYAFVIFLLWSLVAKIRARRRMV